MIKKANLTSENIKEDRIDLIKQLFPEVVAENQIDWEKLRKVLGEDLDNQIEKFNFTWAGKSKAIKAVLEPSKATLKPAKDEGIKFDESENIFIEGDNLEVLKLLQKAYFEKVKMIYIDPPYNTGGDFVYKDDFKSPIDNYLKQTGQKNGDGEKLATNPETSGRFHSDWLTMIYPRLKLAWNLLRDDGVIFISIDDNEMHHLRQIMDEVFGEENFIADIVWQRAYAPVSLNKYFSQNHEYIIAYAKSLAKFNLNRLERSEKQLKDYKNPDNDPRGRWKLGNPSVGPANQKNIYEILTPSGKKLLPPSGRSWLYSKEKFEQLKTDGRIWFGKGENSGWGPKMFISEVSQGITPLTLWEYKEVGHTQDAKKETKNLFGDVDVFSTPKPTDLLKRVLALAANKDDIILDFFAGSGTTSQAVMELNKEDGGHRKFILVQLPEKTSEKSEAYRAGYKTIAEITKERIRRVINGYGDNPQPIDDGFKVFKLDKSNYPENNFEYDPEKTDEENQTAFKKYLEKAGQLPLLETGNSLDVVYENIVKEGLSPNSKITTVRIGSNSLYQATDGEQSLLICLESKVNPDTIKALTMPEFKNKIFICLDSAVDDSAKANLGLNLELKTI